MKKVLRKYFIPHEGNDNKPQILSAQTVAFVCMVAFVAEAAFIFGTTYLAPRSTLFGIVTVNALIDETNHSRTTNNLSPLKSDPLLAAAAQAKANDMATKGYFAHTSPTGVTPWYWFETAGYSFTYAGENLAVNFSDSQDVTNAWMNSPDHRENILNNNFTEIGMATAEGVYKGKPAIFVVELFGAPSPAPIAFVNTASAASGQTAPVTKPVTPVTKPATKPAVKPAPTPVIPGVPTVVLTNTTSVNATFEEMFVAVKGAESGTVPVVSGNTGSGETIPAAPVVKESNMIQRLASDPRKLADAFYFLLMIVFIIATVLNIFIKINVQYPKLIFSGLLVIIVAGLCVLFNQHITFLNAAIL